MAEAKALEMDEAALLISRQEAGGETLEMTANVRTPTEAAGPAAFVPSTVVDADGRMKVQPHETPEFPDLWQWKSKSSGQLWRSLYGWMSGDCGLVLYLQLTILVKSSEVWFHAHHWAVGADPTPCLLQADGTIAPLPAGRRACQLPQFSVMLLLSLLQAFESCSTIFAKEHATMESMLPKQFADELAQRPPKAYNAAITKYVKHAVTYQMLPWSLARATEESGPVFFRALLCSFFPSIALRNKLHCVVEPGGDDDDYHCALQDLTDATKVMKFLATSTSQTEVQLCHERLIEIAVEKNADFEFKAVIAIRQYQYQVEKARSKKERAKGLTRQDKLDAQAAKCKAKEKRDCFSLGFL